MTIKGLGSKLLARKAMVAAVATAVVALAGVATTWIEARGADSKVTKRTEALKVFLERLNAGHDASQGEMERLFETMNARFEWSHSRLESLERRLERCEGWIVGPPAPDRTHGGGCVVDEECPAPLVCVAAECQKHGPDVEEMLDPIGCKADSDCGPGRWCVGAWCSEVGTVAVLSVKQSRPRPMLKAVQKKREKRKAERTDAMAQMEAAF